MAYPFAAADVLTAVDLNAMIGAPTQNTQTGTTYTAVLLDAGKTVTLSNASAVTLTIPAQASVSWADNTQLNFLNIGAGTVTITAAAGVTITGTPLTLATSKGGSLVRTASNTWTFKSGGGEVITSSVFLNTTNGYGSTNNKIRRFTNTVRNSGADITYADTAADGASFTINTTGMYSVHFGDQFSGSNHFGISLNSNQLTTSILTITVSHLLSLGTTATANYLGVSSFSGFLTAGDVVRPHTAGQASGTNSSRCVFSIARVG